MIFLLVAPSPPSASNKGEVNKPNPRLLDAVDAMLAFASFTGAPEPLEIARELLEEYRKEPVSQLGIEFKTKE